MLLFITTMTTVFPAIITMTTLAMMFRAILSRMTGAAMPMTIQTMEIDSPAELVHMREILTRTLLTTVIDGENRPFDYHNDAALLTTPELSSFDETYMRSNPISFENFHGESEDRYGTTQLNEGEDEPPLILLPNEPIRVRRLEEIAPPPKLVSPIPSTSLPTQLEMSTSTPVTERTEVVAQQHLLWDDGHVVKKKAISKTGARLPVRRSHRICGNLDQ